MSVAAFGVLIWSAAPSKRRDKPADVVGTVSPDDGDSPVLNYPSFLWALRVMQKVHNHQLRKTRNPKNVS
eukprot:2930428-Amphidinium_carterae.1